MTGPESSERGSRRAFALVLAAGVLLSIGYAVVLGGPFPLALRQQVSGAGFVLGALAISVSGALAARRCATVRRRRAWQVLAGAAAVALVGNLWTTVEGGDPVLDASPVGDALVATALVMTTFGLLMLSDAPHRRARVLVNSLDGVVVACAVLIMTLVLVVSRLVTTDDFAWSPRVLLFPLLDVAVLTVALLLVVRNQGDRSFYTTVCVGFVLWSVADLVFAVQVPRGTYSVGTPQDLLWLVAYLVLAVSACHPAATGRVQPQPARRSALDVQATLLVFSLLLLAAGVQLAFAQGPLSQTLTGLWVLLVLAVGVRQVLLVSDNQALRNGLERQVAEQTADLRRMKRRTEAMLSSVGDGIYVVDLAGCTTFSSPSALRMLGHEPEDLALVSAHELLHVSGEGVQPCDDQGAHDADACYITRAISHGDVVVSVADCYRRADGSTIPVEATASPLVDGDQVIGAVVVFRDVTERREVDRMKDEFLSVVSHELRTPLTSIRGSLDMLTSGVVPGVPPAATRMLDIATRSSDRLIRLISDILDIERIRSGKLAMDPCPVEAGLLLELAAREMTCLAAKRDIGLQVTGSDVVVLADADRIVQTLTNVVGNAVKFSPPGSTVRLAVVGARGAREGDEVTIEVADEGRGVPADMLATIFEPFEQVDSSDSRDQGGTGLGLAISRGIVERHGGRIWAEAGPSGGTIVRFTLTVASASPAADAADAAVADAAVTTDRAGHPEAVAAT